MNTFLHMGTWVCGKCGQTYLNKELAEECCQKIGEK